MTAAPLSVTEAAKRLGMGRNRAYAEIAEGTFPLPVIRIGSQMKVPAPQVEFFLIFGRKPEPAELMDFVQAVAS